MAFTPDEKYLLTTNGVSNDVSVIDVASLKVIKIDPGRRVAMGCRDFAAVMAAPMVVPNDARDRDAAPAVRWPSTASAIRYGPRQALDDVTFSVAPATFAVLLGLNGAGKTTLFSLITRLYAHPARADPHLRP